MSPTAALLTHTALIRHGSRARCAGPWQSNTTCSGSGSTPGPGNSREVQFRSTVRVDMRHRDRHTRKALTLQILFRSGQQQTVPLR